MIADSTEQSPATRAVGSLEAARNGTQLTKVACSNISLHGKTDGSEQTLYLLALYLARQLVGPEGEAGYLEWDGTGDSSAEVMYCPNEGDVFPDVPHGNSYYYRQTTNGNGAVGEPLGLGFPTGSWGPMTYDGIDRWLMLERFIDRPGAPSDGNYFQVPGLPWPDNVSPDSIWHHGGANAVYEDCSVNWTDFGAPVADGGSR